MPYATGMTYVPPIGAGPGRLLYVQEGNLIAQPFDAERRVLVGEGVTVAESVGVYLDGALFSASSTNLLVYRTADPEFPITWFDRQGNVAGRVSAPGRYASVALSPLETHAVAPLTNPRDSGNSDLWLFDLMRGANPTRFTYFPAMRADFPLWSFDGTQVLFRFPGPAGRQHLPEGHRRRARTRRRCWKREWAGHTDELVARRALRHVRAHVRPDALGPVRRSAGREPIGARGPASALCANAVQRRGRALLARRRVGRLCLQRIRRQRSLHPQVQPGDDQRIGKRRDQRDGFEGRRIVTALATRREGTLLSRARRHDDVGRGRVGTRSYARRHRSRCFKARPTSPSAMRLPTASGSCSSNVARRHSRWS